MRDFISVLLLLSVSGISSTARVEDPHPDTRHHADAPLIFPEGFRRLVAGPSLSNALTARKWCLEMVPRTHLAAPECDAYNARSSHQNKDRAHASEYSARAKAAATALVATKATAAAAAAAATAAAAAAAMDDVVTRALRPLLVRLLLHLFGRLVDALTK